MAKTLNFNCMKFCIAKEAQNQHCEKLSKSGLESEELAQLTNALPTELVR